MKDHDRRLISRTHISLAGLVLMVAGCGLQPNPQAQAGPQQINSLTTQTEAGEYLHTIAFSDGSFITSVFDNKGNELYRQTWPVVDAKGDTFLAWQRLQGAPNQGGQISLKLEAPEMAALHNVAYYVYRQVSKIASDASLDYDSWGCDLPPSVGGHQFDCTPIGGCCDVHDACYAAYGCSQASWSGSEGVACALCNLVVVDCIARGGTAPSMCCALGNCGAPRCPPPLAFDPNCDPRCACGGRYPNCASCGGDCSGDGGHPLL